MHGPRTLKHLVILNSAVHPHELLNIFNHYVLNVSRPPVMLFDSTQSVHNKNTVYLEKQS